MSKQQRLRRKKEREKRNKTIEYLEKSGKLAEDRRLYLEQKARHEFYRQGDSEYYRRAIALAKKKRDFYLTQAEKNFEEMERFASSSSSKPRGKGLHNSSLDGESDLAKALILLNNLLD